MVELAHVNDCNGKCKIMFVMDSICPMITKIICALRTNGQQEIVQSLPLLATTWDWHSQCLRKQLGVLGYPIGIILDNGQALTSDDLSNHFQQKNEC